MKKEISKIIFNKTKLKQAEVEALIETPPNPEMGDYAFPCFTLAKQFKKNPINIAEDLANDIKPNEIIEKIETKGAYLNFFVNKKELAKQVLSSINKDYGKSKSNKEKIVIEFLAPNTNKPLHLGHLRNMSIGESVARILEANGNKVNRINLYNDRGIHIVKSMLAYEKFGKNQKPKGKTDKFVGDYYVLFNKKIKENPELEKESQEMLIKWEKGDKQVLKTWKQMNDWAYQGIEATYKRFGVQFDKQYYESKMYKQGREMVLDGLKKGLFQKRKDNAVVIYLGKELGEKVLLRADNTSVYITQDLYLAKEKYKDYKFDKSIYVVASEQDYHFNVLFKLIELLKLPFSKNLKHLSYGLVNLPEGRMKSREGTVVDADDLIDELQNLAIKGMKEREVKKSKQMLEDNGLKIALSAIKYYLLRVETVKDMTFNPEESLSFEGETGPYLQYSYARANSILKKSKKKPNLKIPTKIENEEIELIKKIADFPNAIDNSAKQLNPSIMAHYAHHLAQTFNEFYHNTKVIGEDEESFRLKIVDSFKTTLKNALYLLGIEVMEEM